MFAFLKYFSLLEQIASELVAVEAGIAAGAPIASPPIFTYLGKQHVSITVTVTPIT